ncbi:MAG: oligoendopeptidase F family protein [Bacilli bacterium]|nr:oligoendopeptidase F family protein [Bacilli bacterium]
MEYKSRKEVPDKYKWDLTDFFKSEDDFNKNLKDTTNLVKKLEEYKGCTKDAKKLYEYLNVSLDCMRLWENLYVYSYLIHDQELGVSESVTRKNKTLVLMNELDKNNAFFVPELLKLERDEYENLFKEDKRLESYRIYLDDIFREKDHVLTENEEKIVSELINSMNNFSDISSTILNNEHNYGKIKLEDGTVETIATNNFRKLTKNANESIRKKVYNSFNKKIDEYSTINAMLLNSYVNMNNSIAKIRNFDSAWDKKLFTLNLNNKVFKSLVHATEKNLNILQKYYNLRKRVLGIDKLHKYDMNLELTKSNKDYNIEEAQDLLLKVIEPLGQDYINHFKKIFDNKYIDYCTYKGKESGAYSFSTLDKDSRILMSFNNDLDSVSTIAHEGGHNVHYQYIFENNPLQYRNTSNIVAEVASLTNECLLSNYLLNNSLEKEEKLAGLENIIRVIVSNLFGAVREAKMEQDMYEYVKSGNTLTKDYLDNLSKKSLKKYYGREVNLDKYAKNDWVNRSHYYMYFYLYSYAISISVATNVASRILSNDKEMLENYLKFLKTGSDRYPRETFLILGVDIEDEEVYNNAIKYFEELINKFEEIYFDKEV